MATLRRRVLIFLLVTLMSCAYFNVYWMAKNEYKDATETGGYDFWDPYSQGVLRGEPARLVDSCIERCGKLLLLHSGSGLVDDALLMMGNCFVLKRDHQNAMRKYDELLELYDTSDLVYDARYMKAYTLVLEDFPQQAIGILKDLAGQTKQKDVRERATYLLGRVFHHEGECDSAIKYLSTYVDRYEDGKRAGRVRLHLASCMVRSEMAGEAILILEPMSGSLDADGIAAALEMGKAYRSLGDYDRSMDILSRIAEGAVEDSVRARAMIESAQTLVEKGEIEAAIQALDEAADVAKGKAPLTMAEAIYAKGMIYEKRMQDFDQAIATYEIISQQKSEFAQRAKKRHKALKSLRKYQSAMSDSIPDTPEDVALNLFMMAEILIEDLGLEEDAREHLKSVADSIPRTDFGARAALRFAALLDAEGDTLACVYRRKVIEIFPNTVYANVARAGLGLPLVDVVAEAPDTAAADSTLEAGPVSGGEDLPDSLSGTGRVLEGPPVPSTPLPPDSVWARRRGSGPPAGRDSAEAQRGFLRPPSAKPPPKDTTLSSEPGPETPVPGEEPLPGEQPDSPEPPPADSSGAEGSEDVPEEPPDEGQDE